MLGKKELKEVVKIGIDLTTEKNKNRLLEKMLVQAMNISNCDAGTMYLYQNNTLVFKNMKTLSQNVDKGSNGEVIDLPPVALVEGNVCAYAAIHRELVNIPDVYHSDRFDFSGPKRYDAITGYRTGSMLVIPMEDAEGVLMGVLQLMNKLDEEGKFIPFGEDDEFAIRSLGSMMAVSLSSMIYIEEIKKQLRSFVSAFATAVDERTPYNGSHTKKVTVYAGILADYINKKYEAGVCEEYFDENRKEQLTLAAALHDIGKMIIPLEVMNKESRLASGMPKVLDRFKLLQAYYERDMYKGVISQAENEEKQRYIEDAVAFILSIDRAGFLPDDKLERVKEIASQKYVSESGEEIAYLTEEEATNLSIRKGTLSDEERQIMESHVVMTKKILDKVHFNVRYENVARFAASHHELLNGSGYPEHLSGEQLGLETRMLAVVDVYDALTSKDRPYKDPIPKSKAFAILHSMVEEGKMEERLVTWLEEALQDIDDAEIERRVQEES